MNEQVMVNEEVIEVMEETVTGNSGKGGMILAAIAGTALVGAAIYKFVVKPIVAKRKAKKEEPKVVGRFIDDESEVIDIEESEE